MKYIKFSFVLLLVSCGSQSQNGSPNALGVHEVVTANPVLHLTSPENRNLERTANKQELQQNGFAKPITTYFEGPVLSETTCLWVYGHSGSYGGKLGCSSGRPVQHRETFQRLDASGQVIEEVSDMRFSVVEPGEHYRLQRTLTFYENHKLCENISESTTIVKLNEKCDIPPLR